MHIFITGASGHIGSLVVPELISHGHTVLALARSDGSARAVQALGADAHRGDLADLDALRDGAQRADGVIHLAFDHGLQRSGDLAGAAAADVMAIHALGDALAGSGKPFVGTNATGACALAGFRGELTEKDVLPGGPRIDAENAVVALARKDVRACVVRLPPTVHSGGAYGFASQLIALARTSGAAGFPATGHHRWPSVHARDAATVYRLAVERAPAGTRLHAVAERGIELRDIAMTIGRRLGSSIAPISDDDLGSHFGLLAPFVGIDNPTTSAWTREQLHWTPNGPGLIEELETDTMLTP